MSAPSHDVDIRDVIRRDDASPESRLAADLPPLRKSLLATKRLFICDPVCAQTFGHNAAALDYFSRALSDRFSDVIPICCKHLPGHVVSLRKFRPLYEFYYHDYLPLTGVTPTYTTLSAPYDRYADEIEGVATLDADRLLDEYNVTASDCILFPSVDFYGVVGLLNALLRRPPASRPRLFLRFIGVMESASHSYRNPLAELIARIRDALNADVRISVGAETPRLSDELADMLEHDVTTVPYPDFHDLVPLPPHGPFIVYCPGSARFDKGYLALLDICAAVRRKDPNLSIRFVAQTLRPRDTPHFAEYTSRLYAIPGVELLESSISDEEMRCQYVRSSLVLLPYDVSIYRNRGSAAMMEAACYGRPIITLRGSAFAEQVEWYRLGRVVDGVDDIAAAILSFSREERKVLERRASRARQKLMADGKAAYGTWLGTAQ